MREVAPELGNPPDTARANDTAVRDVLQALVVQSGLDDQSIARVFSRQDGPELAASRERGGNVLERVHDRVDGSLEQGDFELLRPEGCGVTKTRSVRTSPRDNEGAHSPLPPSRYRGCDWFLSPAVVCSSERGVSVMFGSFRRLVRSRPLTMDEILTSTLGHMASSSRLTSSVWTIASLDARVPSTKTGFDAEG